jgi:hypothetical protein
MRLLAVFLAGLVVGVGGTFAVQTPTDESVSGSEQQATYRECLRELERGRSLEEEIDAITAGGPLLAERTACRREAGLP